MAIHVPLGKQGHMSCNPQTHSRTCRFNHDTCYLLLAVYDQEGKNYGEPRGRLKEE